MKKSPPAQPDPLPLPTLLDIVQQISGRLPPPIVDVTLAVTRFQDLALPARRGASATRHTVTLGRVHPNVELIGPVNNRTIRVKHDGATLRFNIVDEEAHAIYNCVAVTFARVDGAEPKAIYFNDGRQTGSYSPFSALRMNGSTFQFTNTIVGDHQQAILQATPAQPGTSAVAAMSAAMLAAASPAATAASNAAAKPGMPREWMTYKFSVIIQRLNDGAVGIIDPPIENEGDPQGDYMLVVQ